MKRPDVGPQERAFPYKLRQVVRFAGRRSTALLSLAMETPYTPRLPDETGYDPVDVGVQWARLAGQECVLSSGWRWALFAWSLVLIAGFCLAASLEPDPRGYGTHQRLGLPECSLRQWLGIPCPSCGGTTTFALFVRGRWASAVQVNLAAFGLAVWCATMIPWSLYSAAIGRAWRIRRPDVVLAWLLGTFGMVSLVQWLAALAAATWH